MMHNKREASVGSFPAMARVGQALARARAGQMGAAGACGGPPGPSASQIAALQAQCIPQPTGAVMSALGLLGTSTAAGASSSLAATVIDPFVPSQLMIPAYLADSMLITGLTINGKNPFSNLSATNPWPGSIFSTANACCGCPLSLPGIQQNQSVAIAVTNQGGAAITPAAILCGWTVAC